ncbi:MAG: hypothetical protein AAFP92_11005 [Bacteroidota bacterium]
MRSKGLRSRKKIQPAAASCSRGFYRLEASVTVSTIHRRTATTQRKIQRSGCKKGILLLCSDHTQLTMKNLAQLLTLLLFCVASLCVFYFFPAIMLVPMMVCGIYVNKGLQAGRQPEQPLPFG